MPHLSPPLSLSGQSASTLSACATPSACGRANQRAPCGKFSFYGKGLQREL